MHNVVGSFDFLGDPVGLLSNLSTGVKDFFYEPLEGLKPDGKGFLYGLGKGGTSLVSNTMQARTTLCIPVVSAAQKKK